MHDTASNTFNQGLFGMLHQFLFCMKISIMITRICIVLMGKGKKFKKEYVDKI